MKQVLILLTLLTVGSSVGAATPEEKKAANFEYQTTTKEGLTFRVPEDMPIEKRDGIMAPIPFDEYMYGKFKQLEKKMQGLEEKIAQLEKMLTQKDDKQKAVLTSQ